MNRKEFLKIKEELQSELEIHNFTGVYRTS